MNRPPRNIRHQVAAYCKEPVGIYGYGVEGRSTCGFLMACGVRSITVFDSNKPDALPEGVAYGGSGEDLQSLSRIETLFRSAGIRPDIPAFRQHLAGKKNLTSQIELFFSLVPPSRIVGITGTLGKGTCCSLLEAMLRKAGMPVALGGNIGKAALDMLADFNPDTIYILELSSFQLSTLHRSPSRAAVLKTTSEHLDWHLDNDEYWACKANLVRHMNGSDFLIFHADSPGSRAIAGQAACKKVGYGDQKDIHVANDRISCSGASHVPAIKYRDLKMAGSFNLENIAAAGAIAKNLGVTEEAIYETACEFTGLPHRMEYVGEADTIRYFNDSYATRPEAAIGAIKSFTEAPLGVILGGSEKHADFKDLADTIAGSSHIHAVALIGYTAKRLRAELQACIQSTKPDLQICDDLDAAVRYLQSFIRHGVILLSPACASFGLFENYKHRGEVFRAVVRSFINNPETSIETC